MNNYFDSVSKSILTPSDCIRAMQKDTCDGVLEFPFWEADDDCKDYYICKINWTAEDAEKIVAEYEELYSALSEIEGCYGDDEELDVKNTAVCNSPRLSELWDIYLRPFEVEEFDGNRISKIQDNLEDGKKLSKADDKYYDRYCAAIYDDCARRLSGSVCTYEVVLRAKRVFYLMIRNAPQIILNIEASKLAAAMALRAFCTEKELVEV